MKHNEEKRSRLYKKLIASGLSNRKINKILSPKNKVETKKSFVVVFVGRITNFIFRIRSKFTK